MMAMDCARVDQEDLVSRYVGGRLGDAELAAFETHCLTCERCWAEVRAGVEIRDAAGIEFIVPRVTPRRAPLRDAWTLLAAAAAIALVAIGLRQLAGRSDEVPRETVYRSAAEGSLSLAASSPRPGELELRWNPVPDADTYVAELIASDGTTLLQRKTSSTAIRLDTASFPPAEAGVRLFATVEAKDSMQQTIARSGRVTVPFR